MISRTEIPTLRDIEEAQRRIAGIVCKTPLVESPALSKTVGREVYLKLECFQPVRVFKIRGAYNKVSQVREKSVITVSSGNHGMAVAYSARALGKKCTVILPENPVREKADAIAELGAEIIEFGRYHKEREEKAQQVIRRTGAVYVHPFDDPAIIAGGGTCGLEIVEQLSEFDSVVVPVGGAGLISGVSIAVKTKSPRVKVFGAEPTGAPKLRAALQAGKVVSIESPHSIADGLYCTAVGELTFKVCSMLVDGVFTVTDDEIIAGMKAMIRGARIFPEPSGSAGLAALLANRDIDELGRRVVLVVSGGNVSQKLLAQVLTSRKGYPGKTRVSIAGHELALSREAR